jgi:membrane-associated phospholipid phosphatase
MILDFSTTLFTKVVWWAWLIVLLASTLLVHQHHLLDVISGLGVALMCRYWMREGENRV